MSSPPPRKKKMKSAVERGDVSSKYAPPDLDLESLGGVAVQKAALQEAVVLPLLYPDIFAFSGHQRPCGVLLHGVPGGGKTHLVRCLAGVSRFCQRSWELHRLTTVSQTPVYQRVGA